VRGVFYILYKNAVLYDIFKKFVNSTCSRDYIGQIWTQNWICQASGIPRNFVHEGCSTNSVEDRGQRERGSGSGSPL